VQLIKSNAIVMKYTMQLARKCEIISLQYVQNIVFRNSPCKRSADIFFSVNNYQINQSFRTQ